MRIAILGATGAVGRTMLRVLEERAFPVDELVLLASERSEGTRIAAFGKDWTVRAVTAEAFDGCDIALFSAGSSRSREWAPIAAQRGAIVIDNSSCWRMEPDVPLVVPEVNGERVHDAARGIIANPNCATIQLVVALEAIKRAAGLDRVVVTTFQSVSGAGNKGIAALDSELAGEKTETPFVAPIAHNVIPYIGPRGDDGWNEEEDKIRAETRRILEMPDLAVSATCVRVPVRIGHSISVTVQTARPLDRPSALSALKQMSGIAPISDNDPLPLNAAGTDDVYVGHVRSDRDVDNTLHLWVVADNLRKGAATNAVQIAEALLKQKVLAHA
ncbi:MAG TPA: aspartate-semialdehyde dehydrogenase [Longimicrobiales bacterium]|nr:aspartate-semialdehyde dehydrogenase [Longimicrobiales bacterium]